MKTSTQTWGRGYVRNAGRRALPRYSRLGAGTLPAGVDLRSLAVLTTGAPVAVFDQGQTGSCVAHATSMGLVIARAAAKDPLPWVPSPALLYAVARCLERDWNEPLADNGCDPVDMLDALQRWGMKAMGPAQEERNSDVGPLNVNDAPDLLSLEWGQAWLALDDYEIQSFGQAKVDDVALALAGGHPVRIVVPGGDAAWQQYDSATALSDSGGPLDHCVLLVGYDVQGRFIGRNSWGTGWGQAGDFLCDDSVVKRSTECIATVAKEPAS